MKVAQQKKKVVVPSRNAQQKKIIMLEKTVEELVTLNEVLSETIQSIGKHVFEIQDIQNETIRKLINTRITDITRLETLCKTMDERILALEIKKENT